MITRLLLMLAIAVVAKDGPTKLESPNYISPKLREALAKRMENHGRSAMRLTIGVVLLAYRDVAEVALELADATGLAKPRPGEEGTLNAALPPPFFVFQDQLRARASELARVAGQRNNSELSKSFARLTETCMACHAVYLHGLGAEEEWWPLGKGLRETTPK